MGDGARAPTQIISLPQGGGAIRGIGETFAPDLQTGTGNFTVPIAVPAGRARPAAEARPGLQHGQRQRQFGLGWSLSIPGISRKTSRGVPSYDDEQDTFILSGSEDLVPVDRISRDRGALPATRRKACSPESSTTAIRATRQDYWEVTSKDGLVSRYGSRPAGSAPSDWRDPAVTSPTRPSRPASSPGSSPRPGTRSAT